MSLRYFLMIMSIVSAFAAISWLVVVYSVDPTKSGFLGFVLFFSALAATSLSFTTLLGTIIRVWVHPHAIIYREVVKSLRQGALLTTLLILSLILSGFGLFNWWVLILLVLVTGYFELILSGSNPRLNTK